MKKMSSVCDWFVIASGTSTTHTRAIADSIVKKLTELREKLWHKEGEREASWILLDYGDVVAHIFLEETRAFYDLEKLWGDAPQERFKERKPKKTTKKKKKKITIKKRVKRSKK